METNLVQSLSSLGSEFEFTWFRVRDFHVFTRFRVQVITVQSLRVPRVYLVQGLSTLTWFRVHFVQIRLQVKRDKFRPMRLQVKKDKFRPMRLQVKGDKFRPIRLQVSDQSDYSF